METRFFYDLQDKQLCFKLRQKVDTGYGIEAKGKGVFNTADGSLSYRVHAKKMVCTTERLKDASTTPLLLGERRIALLMGACPAGLACVGRQAPNAAPAAGSRNAARPAACVRHCSMLPCWVHAGLPSSWLSTQRHLCLLTRACRLWRGGALQQQAAGAGAERQEACGAAGERQDGAERQGGG